MFFLCAVRCGWGSGQLSYSAALEQAALAWASSCPSPSAPFDPSASDGENVFFLNPGGAAPYSGDVVTQLWSAEASTWSCPADACADSVSRCRNFRQIVWSSTTLLGCAAVSNCSGAFPVVYVCRYRTAGNIVGQHPLANPQLQCPLNGAGSCAGTTTTTTTTTSGGSSSTSTSSSTTGTSTTTPSQTVAPTYPPTCSAAPTPVTVIRAPQTRVRFAFDGLRADKKKIRLFLIKFLGLLKGVCDLTPTPTPAPCPGTCPVITPNNVQVRAASLVL